MSALLVAVVVIDFIYNDRSSTQVMTVMQYSWSILDDH